MSQYPKDQRITVNGLDFHYRDWGGSGQSLVLLHGLASTCHIWDLVAPILADDYAVVALDQRGHGESAKPDEGYHFASVARDLLGFIQGMGLEGAIIVGHSWGGDVALEFAVAYPSVARGLCFVDGGMIEPSARYSSLAETREQMAPPVLSGMTVAQFLERIRNGNQARMMTPQVEEAILANFAVQEDEHHPCPNSAARTTYESSKPCGSITPPTCTARSVSRCCSCPPVSAATPQRWNGWSEGKPTSPLPPGPYPGARSSGWKTASTTYHCNARTWSPTSSGSTFRGDSSVNVPLTT